MSSGEQEDWRRRFEAESAARQAVEARQAALQTQLESAHAEHVALRQALAAAQDREARLKVQMANGSGGGGGNDGGAIELLEATVASLRGEIEALLDQQALHANEMQAERNRCADVDARCEQLQQQLQTAQAQSHGGKTGGNNKDEDEDDRGPRNEAEAVAQRETVALVRRQYEAQLAELTVNFQASLKQTQDSYVGAQAQMTEQFQKLGLQMQEQAKQAHVLSTELTTLRATHAQCESSAKNAGHSSAALSASLAALQSQLQIVEAKRAEAEQDAKSKEAIIKELREQLQQARAAGSPEPVAAAAAAAAASSPSSSSKAVTAASPLLSAVPASPSALCASPVPNASSSSAAAASPPQESGPLSVIGIPVSAAHRPSWSSLPVGSAVSLHLFIPSLPDLLARVPPPTDGGDRSEALLRIPMLCLAEARKLGFRMTSHAHVASLGSQPHTFLLERTVAEEDDTEQGERQQRPLSQAQLTRLQILMHQVISIGGGASCA
jgi:chromosome segregation ATPase